MDSREMRKYWGFESRNGGNPVAEQATDKFRQEADDGFCQNKEFEKQISFRRRWRRTLTRLPHGDVASDQRRDGAARILQFAAHRAFAP